jgi:hypothetical protein
LVIPLELTFTFTLGLTLSLRWRWDVMQCVLWYILTETLEDHATSILGRKGDRASRFSQNMCQTK